MPGITRRDISFVVNRYIGVSDGYLGDFSYRLHAEFYGEYCELGIDPNQYEGTTRERFIQILSEATPRIQARILAGVLEKYPVGSSALRTPETGDHIRSMIETCLAAAAVEVPELATISAVVARAIDDAETLMRANGPTSAVDRVHTALHGYLKAICAQAGYSYSSDPSILDLFKVLKRDHPNLQALGAHQGPIVQVLRSLGSVMDALNPARNRGSVAHPNDELLDEDEAILFINAARTVLQFLDAKLREK